MNEEQLRQYAKSIGVDPDIYIRNYNDLINKGDWFENLDNEYMGRPVYKVQHEGTTYSFPDLNEAAGVKTLLEQNGALFGNLITQSVRDVPFNEEQQKFSNFLKEHYGISENEYNHAYDEFIPINANLDDVDWSKHVDFHDLYYGKNNYLSLSDIINQNNQFNLFDRDYDKLPLFSQYPDIQKRAYLAWQEKENQKNANTHEYYKNIRSLIDNYTIQGYTIQKGTQKPTYLWEPEPEGYTTTGDSPKFYPNTYLVSPDGKEKITIRTGEEDYQKERSKRPVLSVVEDVFKYPGSQIIPPGKAADVTLNTFWTLDGLYNGTKDLAEGNYTSAALNYALSGLSIHGLNRGKHIPLPKELEQLEQAYELKQKSNEIGRVFDKAIKETKVIPKETVYHGTTVERWNGNTPIVTQTGSGNAGFSVTRNPKTAQEIALKRAEQEGGTPIVYKWEARISPNNTTHTTDPGSFSKEFDNNFVYDSTLGYSPEVAGTNSLNMYGNDVIAYENLFERGNGDNISYLITNPNNLIIKDPNHIAHIEAPQTNQFIENGRETFTGKGVEDLKYDGFDDFRLLGNNIQVEDANTINFTIPGKGFYRVTDLEDGRVYVSMINKGKRKNQIISRSEFVQDLMNEKKNILSENNTFRKLAYLEADAKQTQTVQNGEALNQDISKLNQDLINKIDQTVQDNIDLIYKSEEYANRFKKAGFTEAEYNEFLKEIDELKRIAIATYYRTFNPSQHGISNLSDLTYGFNLNTIAEDIEEFISSILFHEFGHTQYRASEIQQLLINSSGIAEKASKFPMIEKVRKYNEHILSLYNVPKAQRMDNIIGKFSNDYYEYVTKNEELTQRLRQNMKSRIENGLEDSNSNESWNKLFSRPEVQSTELTEFYKRIPLKSMVSKILSVTPIILGTNYVYNNNKQQKSN